MAVNADSMNVQCVQFAPERAQVSANREKMKALFPKNADLVVFPELATSGYLAKNRDEMLGLAEEADGETTAMLATLAKDNGAIVAYGFPEKHQGGLYNSAALVGADGLIGVYRKVHLFDRETLIFNSGQEEWPVFEINDVRIGLMVCFDWIFPEAARALALKGADIIAHPSNLVLPFCQDAMITRSIENRVFSATCNRIGTEQLEDIRLTFTGLSQVVSNKGERITQANDEEEIVISAIIEPKLARDKQVTAHNHIFTSRKPNLYKRLIESNETKEKPYRKNVAVIVVNDEGLILCGERGDIQGVWQLPQGGVDDGEDEESAMRRELSEETGIAMDDIDILGITKESYGYDFPDWLADMPLAKEYKGQMQRYFAVRLREGVKPDIAKSDKEFRSFQWLPKEEILRQIIDFKRPPYEKAFNELENVIKPLNERE